ncbi:MAG: hypothetical protein KAR32_15125 [Candidatus Omnitrophica bacterium]|nr:hypothetical protein [Candidatus Omnitrophota bacterium]MCK5260394.1 hypothetical protein [Candidatus Omnitrophota bacterium]
MKRSRKNKGCRKLRHYRQLRDQRQRETVRGEKKYVPAGFVLGLFLRRHKVEIFLFVFLISGVLSIILLGPDKRAINEMSASLSAVIEEKSSYWDEAYPYGYKIIALTDTDIVHTSFDTLPEDLEINWKNLFVTRIQAKQFGNTQEKIKISMDDIYYAPDGVSGLSITTTLVRRAGASAVLMQFNDLEFVAEIVENNEKQVFCLLGLR